MKKTLLLPVALLSLAGTANAETPKRPWRPEMTRLPTSGQFGQVLKRLHVKGEPIGWALLQCHVAASGDLAPCSVILEAPELGLIGQMALGLAPFMRVKPAMENGKTVDGGSIFVPINIGSVRNNGAFKSSYVAGNPSYAVLPPGDARPGRIKIPCPTEADPAAICPALPIYWSDTLSLEENAPTLLEAQQATDFSAVSCRYAGNNILEDCRIKGQDGPRVSATVHKILSTLKAPKWADDNAAVTPTRVTIVFNWTMLTKAATAIVAAAPELASPKTP